MKSLILLLLIALTRCVAAEPVEVHLHLPAYHQFRFAGYYAADDRGYFIDEGLRVIIHEAEPDRTGPQAPVGNEFLIARPALCERWAAGEDLFLVAIIQQRNPFVMLVRTDSPLRRIPDLAQIPVSRRVAPAGDHHESELWSSLLSNGLDPDRFFPRSRGPGDHQRFITGELDALPADSAVDPYLMINQGIAIRPLESGPYHNLFFGDVILCSTDLWRERPRLVEGFRRASIRGWEHALSHREELINHILTKRHSIHQTLDRAFLEQEADGMAMLIDAEHVPIGTVDHTRMERLAARLRSTGLDASVPALSLYPTVNVAARRLMLLLVGSAVVVLAFIFLAMLTRRQHRSLTENQAHYRHLIELAEGYFAFRVRLIGDRIEPELASPSIQAILGLPLTTYQKDSERFFRQMSLADRKALGVAARRTLRDGRPLRMRIPIDHASGNGRRELMVHALHSMTERGAIFDGICVDLTQEASADAEQRRLRRQLEVSHRHESLGLLAGGVAHDFNNILGAIRGNAELLRPVAEANPAAGRRIERLLMAADRAAGLVRQILAYTGKGVVEERALDLAREIRQLAGLLRHSLPTDTSLDLALAEDLPPVRMDPVQFQQVVLNLIVNAAESYQGAAGVVTVSLVKRDQVILLRVSDLGSGMDSETMERMWEPYFTTKERGHGLGLAAVRGIVQRVGGTIECRSTIGKGTTFVVTLPVSKGRRDSTVDREPPQEATPGGSKILLIVDDDEGMLDVAATMLREMGHQVETGTNGKGFMEAAERLGDTLHAAVVDCRMPDLDGTEVLRRLRAKGFAAPVLLMSGFAHDADVRRELADPRTRFLSKPFSRAQLAAALASLFGGGSDEESTARMSPVPDWVRSRNWRDSRTHLPRAEE